MDGCGCALINFTINCKEPVLKIALSCDHITAAGIMAAGDSKQLETSPKQNNVALLLTWPYWLHV
jgi:hypothetical protein